MKIFGCLRFYFFLLFTLYPIFVFAGFSSRTDILSLLPDEGEIQGLKPLGDPQTARSKDLYLLINGGAEIYYEYGFKQVVLQTYGKGDVNALNLEIYEMNSSKSAYGIYTFKTGRLGKPVNVGQDAWLENYYLNFWKGNFLITLVGLDTKILDQEQIIEIAELVSSKIIDLGTIPDLVKYLPAENLKSNGITYLKGNLGLFNQYEFDGKNIFGLYEGIIARYLDHSLFVFQYCDVQESESLYDSAKIQLITNDRFHSFIDQEGQYTFIDKKDKRITVRRHQRWIFIILANQNLDAIKKLKLLEMKFNQ